MKHTPGPWFYDSFGNITKHPPRKGLRLLLPTMGIVAKVNKINDGPVIAAAPDMKEALEWAIHAFDEEVGIKAFANGNVAHGVDEGEVMATRMINAMKHAIKKAKGEEVLA